MKAAFTPGNSIFSGHVPTLVTTDDNLKRIYHSAVMSALYFRRTTPHSVYGTTYVTLMPRYWETTTFLWDISLSAMLLSMLDPAVLRGMMEMWMKLDMHKHFGTEFLTGAGVGPWYSVNDYAMCRMAKEYLRWTGDRAWLDKEVDGKKVLNHLLRYAEHWRELNVNKHGLADYGGVTNLLEAVSSYVHEVAGLNAANVHNLRFAAELVEYKGRRREGSRVPERSRRARTTRSRALCSGKRNLEMSSAGWKLQRSASLLRLRHDADEHRRHDVGDAEKRDRRIFQTRAADADMDACAFDARSRCHIQHPSGSSMDRSILLVAGTCAERTVRGGRSRCRIRMDKRTREDEHAGTVRTGAFHGNFSTRRNRTVPRRNVHPIRRT